MSRHFSSALKLHFWKLRKQDRTIGECNVQRTFHLIIGTYSICANKRLLKIRVCLLVISIILVIKWFITNRLIRYPTQSFI